MTTMGATVESAGGAASAGGSDVRRAARSAAKPVRAAGFAPEGPAEGLQAKTKALLARSCEAHYRARTPSIPSVLANAPDLWQRRLIHAL